MIAIRPVATARRVAWELDHRVAAVGRRPEPAGLLTLLLHSVFEGQAEIDRNLVYPQEGLTVGALRRSVEELLAAAYVFVGVEDLVRGLDPGGRYACLTFDDGYANNLRAVPVLEEYGVPAAVFVSTNHVLLGRRFWWDTLYVERSRRGARPETIEREMATLKGRAPRLIEAGLEREFGEGASVPASDLDRPLTAEELRALAAHPLVTVGNHTMAHPLLTTLDSHDLRVELVGAQGFLENTTGSRPLAVAYPSGDVNDAVVEAARLGGLVVGFTATPRRERTPVSEVRRLRLGRFQPRAEGGVDAALRVLRSRFQLVNSARRVRRWLHSR